MIIQNRKSRTGNVKHEMEIIIDKQRRTYDCTLSCIFDDNEQVCGVVSVLRDVTREKEISQMKNDFVSHVSHELKTPLASILAYVEMLVDGEAPDDDTCQEFYSIIQTQAQRLNNLIEDILNISRIESGLVKVKKETISTSLLIHEAVGMIKSYAAEKDICVKDDTAVVFDQVLADKDMISQVIINLLSNAVKYTKLGGKVTIKSSVDECREVARIDISDTGVGIPSDDVEHIFDKIKMIQFDIVF